MAIALSTNYLAELVASHDDTDELREQLAALNSALAQEQLGPHVEPEVRGTTASRSELAGFPRSDLHRLRRAYAYVYLGDELAPDAKVVDDDPILDEATDMQDSHLLCHGDEGFYVPIDFAPILDSDEVPGQLIGSSMRLFAELVELAPAIGIELSGTTLSDGVATRIAKGEDKKTPFRIERIAWLALFEAARVSIADCTLIVLH